MFYPILQTVFIGDTVAIIQTIIVSAKSIVRNGCIVDQSQSRKCTNTQSQYRENVTSAVRYYTFCVDYYNNGKAIKQLTIITVVLNFNRVVQVGQLQLF